MIPQPFLWSLTAVPTRRGRTGRRPAASRVCLEPLEDRRLLSFSPVVTYPVGLTPGATVASDFDNDGRTDLAAVNRGQNTVSVILGSDGGAFQAAGHSGTGARPVAGRAGDLNGDGKVDLVTVNVWDPYAFSGDLSVLLGNGDGHFQAPRSVGLPAISRPSGAMAQTPHTAVLADLNADGRPDLVVGGQTRSSVVVGYDGETGAPIYQEIRDAYLNVLLGTGNGNFGPGTAYPLNSSSINNMAVGDFDGDSKLDVATHAGGLTTLLGNGDGTLQTPRRTRNLSFLAVGGDSVADFDGDGRPDLLTRDDTGNAVVVLPGNGDGTFRQGQTLFVDGVHSAAAGDVNADGKPDIVVLNSNYPQENQTEWVSSARVLLGRADGTFAPQIISELATPPATNFTSLVLADFDGDGLPELAGCVSASDYENDYQGFVAVAHNGGNWATKTWIGPGGSGSGGNWSTAANWSPSGVPTALDVVSVDATAITLTESTTIGGLILGGGATLTVAVNGAQVLRSASLNMSGDAKLNLNDNSLILDYTGATPFAEVVMRLAAGRGTSPVGIYSSQANASGSTRALGLAEAKDILGLTGAQTSTFAGQTVDDSTLLVKFTTPGDTDLDEMVGFSDLVRLAQNYNSSIAGTWSGGDFNYDQRVDFADLVALAQNYDRVEVLFSAASVTSPPLVGSNDVEVLSGKRRLIDKTFSRSVHVRKASPPARTRRATHQKSGR